MEGVDAEFEGGGGGGRVDGGGSVDSAGTAPSTTPSVAEVAASGVTDGGVWGSWGWYQISIWFLFLVYLLTTFTGVAPRSLFPSGRTFVVLAIFTWFLSWGPWALFGVSMLVASQLYQLYQKQDSILYHPTLAQLGNLRRAADFPPYLRMGSPAQRGLPYEEVRVRASDGVGLVAWMVWADPAGAGVADAEARGRCPTIVFFHGNAGAACMRLANVEALYLGLSRRVNVLMAEYRGYGDCEGEPSEQGLQRDVRAYMRWLGEDGRVDGRLVFVFGRSLGGAVIGCEMGSGEFEGQVAGAVIENTFTSAGAMARKLFPALTPFLPLMLRLQYDVLGGVRRTRIPTLFVAGAEDEVVPHEMMLQLFAAHPLPEGMSGKELLVVPNGDHNYTWERGGGRYLVAFNTFIATVSFQRLQTNGEAGREARKVVGGEIFSTTSPTSATPTSTTPTTSSMSERDQETARAVLDSVVVDVDRAQAILHAIKGRDEREQLRFQEEMMRVLRERQAQEGVGGVGGAADPLAALQTPAVDISTNEFRARGVEGVVTELTPLVDGHEGGGERGEGEVGGGAPVPTAADVPPSSRRRARKE
jgi:fermentation-respiration switch protein FrsA (DUF1100 family)